MYHFGLVENSCNNLTEVTNIVNVWACTGQHSEIQMYSSSSVCAVEIPLCSTRLSDQNGLCIVSITLHGYI